MKRRVLIVVLSVFAVAVAIENVLFFTSFGSDLGRTHQELDEALDPQEMSTETEPLPPIEPAHLSAWLGQRLGPPRSPFLTRAEAEQLGESQALSLPHLSATLWSAGRRVAWIDGSPRSEGDFVREHEVESIEPQGVLLRRRDSRVHLQMEWAPSPLLQNGWRDDVD